MKTGKIIWGIILVSIGGILLLENLGVIDFYWGSIWHFWPVILILAGLNMVFSRNESRTGALISVAATCIVMAFIVYSGINGRNSDRFRYDEDEVSWDNDRNDVFNEELTPGIHKAVLNISGGANSFVLNDTTDKLFNAVAQSSAGYSLKKISRDSTEVLTFNMNQHRWRRMGDGGNATIKLNNEPVWGIHLKMGAGDADFDLSRFKVEDISFDGGVASIKIRLGEPVSSTNVNVKSGVSDISISVPESAACQIKIKSGLSSKDFEGFTQMGDGTYVTPNFHSAAKKIVINLNGGLSNFEVHRY